MRRFAPRLVDPRSHVLRRCSLLGFALACLAPSVMAIDDAAPADAVFHLADTTLRGSRWGPAGQLQHALDGELVKRGLPGVEVDGCLGPQTREALARLGACAGYEDVGLAAGASREITINAAAWERLVRVPAPDADARAMVLVLTHEGTDFDRVEWNLGTRDDASILTWGPFGATVGAGGEVQAILARLLRRDEAILREAFGREAPAAIRLAKMRSRSQARRLMTFIHARRSRRVAWVRAFRALGASEAAREEYVRHALVGDAWLLPPLRRLEGLVPVASPLTEIDRAFFLDLAVQCTVDDRRVAVARERLDELAERLGREPTPPERRRCIGEAWETFVRKTWRLDRRARNLAFTVDALPLSAREEQAWNRRRTRASAAGLSDARTVERTADREP